MITKQPLHMWQYWRDSKGFETAIFEYFPELLDDPEFKTAYLNWKGFKVIMEARINELGEEQQ